MADVNASPRANISLLPGDKPLPHNTEAEKAVIGAILLDPETAVDSAADMLNFAGSFYHPAHQEVFQIIIELVQDGSQQMVDPVTVADSLKQKQKLEQVGGRAYLTELLNCVATAANVEYYADIVYKNAVLRKLIRSGNDIVNRCYEPDMPVKELVDKIEGEITSIVNLKDTATASAVGDEVLDVIEHIEKLQERDQSAIGVQTGYSELDSLITGLQPGQMFILAARPSVGKTAMGLNIAENMAIASDNPVPVGIFSLEMNIKLIVLRLLCSRARVNLSELRDGALSKGRWQEIMGAAQELKEAPIYVDDAASHLDIMELRAKARRMKREHDVQVLVIDYLQLLKPVGAGRNTTRENEVAQISGGLKSLATEMDIPIIVLAQLNRQAEQAGQRPKLSNLRESGAIEQDADVVALLHRERAEVEQESSEAMEGMEAEIILAKHRNGPTGVVPLTFVPAYTRFESRSRISDEDVPAEV